MRAYSGSQYVGPAAVRELRLIIRDLGKYGDETRKLELCTYTSLLTFMLYVK